MIRSSNNKPDNPPNDGIVWGLNSTLVLVICHQQGEKNGICNPYFSNQCWKRIVQGKRTASKIIE